jgi:hypothetical protein
VQQQGLAQVNDAAAPCRSVSKLAGTRFHILDELWQGCSRDRVVHRENERVHLRTHLLAMGEFVTARPKSVFQLNARRFGLKALPVQIATRPWPVAIVMLKNRTLSPVVEMFVTV